MSSPSRVQPKSKRRWGTVVVVSFAVALLAACGSSSGSSSSSSKDTKQSAGGSSSSSSSSAPASSGGNDSSAFCAAAKEQLDALPKQFQSLIQTRGQGAGWLAYADAAEKNNALIGRLAPSEIKADYSVLAQTPAAIIKVIRDSNGNITAIGAKIATATAASRTPQFTAAAGRWTAYLKDHCNLTIPGATP